MNKETDLLRLRGFMTGVMRWRPVDVEETPLAVLAAAIEAFADFHGMAPSATPDGAFLRDMMKRFPDKNPEDNPI